MNEIDLSNEGVPTKISKQGLILATLDNGDSALFCNGEVIFEMLSWEEGNTFPRHVGEKLSKALGMELQTVSMQTPADVDWDWGLVLDTITGGN